MTVKIEPDELSKVIKALEHYKVIKALEHYDAYLRATLREDSEFARIVERLKRSQ